MKKSITLFTFLTFYILTYAQGYVGWTNLFNGKNLEGWKQMGGKATFSVEGNSIVGTTVLNSRNSFLATEKEFDDFILEADVLVEDTSGNSGIQVRSHFDPNAFQGEGRVYGLQCEVDPTPRAWSGGIYDEGRREWLYPMQMNPGAQKAFKKGAFNHFRIECIGNEIKTWVNDIPSAYLVDTIKEKGFIALQVHAIGSANQVGKKVIFRNIRIKTQGLKSTPFAKDIYVMNLVPNSLTDYEKKNGWRLLFDGKTSKGWKSAREAGFPRMGWVTEDGAMSVLKSEGKESTNGGDIVTTEQFSSFDLSFEFRITPGANSGVKYFVTLNEQTTGSAIGLEYQILDDTLHPDAKMGRNGNRTLASLYDLIKAEKQKRFLRPTGQWNIGRIIVDPHNKVEHYLNGVKVLEYERGSKQYRDLVAISKYVIWKNFGEAEKGHILLQDHGDQVSYRSLKIKELK